jgi:predicted RNA binding protein YcfA (HicA-like mRNA interferase family)
MDEFAEKLKRSPNNVRFDELDRFLVGRGFRSRQRGTSHVVYKRNDGARLTIARPHGGEKSLNRGAIRDVLRFIAAEEQATDGENAG